MRAFAMTGIVTASWMPSIMLGSDIRATPPSLRMSDGTRSRAITAAAPAASAIRAWSGVTTSMITPPFSISASPAFTRNVAVSRIAVILAAAGPPGRSRNSRSTYPTWSAICMHGMRNADHVRGGARPGALLEPERLDAVRVRRLVLGVHAVGERLDQPHQRRVRAHVGRRIRRVVETLVGQLRDLAERGVGDRDRGGAAMAREFHRPHDERVRAPGREADHERLLVDPAKTRQALLRRRRHHLAAEVEQHQEVTQVGREERHLVGPAEEDLLGVRDALDGRGHLVAVDLAGGLDHVHVIGRERRLELGLVDREERLRGGGLGGGGATRRSRAPVLLPRGRLQLGEALEAERLREAHDRRGGRVRATGELLRRVEGGLVEVVDYVLADVLLRAREGLEALADLSRQGQGMSRGA